MVDFKDYVIVIQGPTASGKTELSINLSEYLDIEIISADSRQIFKHMDIGTAKPSPDELSQVKHHFIDFLNPDDYFSSGLFAKLAQEEIFRIKSLGKIPVVVGGAGLYIKSLFDGIFESTTDNRHRELIRKDLQTKLEQFGKDFLFDELVKVDNVSAEKYSDKNPTRIVRALEHYYATGERFSDAQGSVMDMIYKPIYFALDYDRQILYDRINLRTLIMWEQGILAETQNLLEMGYSRELNSLNTVGYKECLNLIDGKYNADYTIEKIQQNTRNYAKRQLTWFRKVENTNWINYKQRNKSQLIMDICQTHLSKNS